MLNKLFRISIFLLFVLNLFAQPQKPERPLNIESHIFNYGDETVCYFAYKVSYNRLVFVKNGENYIGGLTLTLEAQKDDLIIDRETATDNIEVNKYKDTESTDKYLEGLIELSLKPGETYTITPFVNLVNTNQNGTLPSFEVEIPSRDSTNFAGPIIVYNDSSKCDFRNGLRLANYNGFFPYSDEAFNIVLPALPSFADSAIFKLEQNSNLYFEEVVKASLPESYSLVECENKIMLMQDDNEGVNYKLFKIKDIHHYLDEGKARLSVITDNDSSAFLIDVKWVEKPKTLRDIKYAVELIEVIANRDTVEKILDAPEEKQYSLLKEFWAKLDPIKETKYNEIMAEFYKRADFAFKEFATINKPDGIKSDRGQIYIKFGKPTSVNRRYSESNQIIEIWRYENLDRKFVFVDESGLGNFKLVE